MKNKIFDAIGQLPERRIEEALSVDSAEKLQSEMKREKRKKLRRVLFTALPAACVCLILAAALPVLFSGKTPAAQVVSPITELGSVAELEQALGTALPVPENKKAARCLLFSADGQPYKGEITFTDNTVLAVGMGTGTSTDTGDISGIWGGTAVGTDDILGVSVRYCTYTGIEYAVFTCGGRPYCYYNYTSEQDPPLETVTDALSADVENIITLINERKDK